MINKNDMFSGDEKPKFMISKFSDALISEYNIVSINDQLYTYKDGVYVSGEKAIEQYTLQYFPEMRSSQRKEVLAHIRLKAKECNNINKHIHLIAFKNGVYNILTKELQPFSKDYIITNKINWEYNPDAYSKDVETLFNKISCYDADMRALLEEIVGYAMYRSLEKQVAFILVGVGSNGKSTYTKVIRNLLGEENCSSRELATFSTDKFASADLFGKLANFGDDISGEYISDPATFKSLASGENITAQRKFGQPFNFTSYALHIYTTNDIPRVKNADGGLLRRLIFPMFEARFKETDPDFDPYIGKRIMYDEGTCEEAMSYLINIALAGLHRALEGSFTIPEKCKKAAENYNRECNPTLDWAEEYLEKYTTFHMLKRDDVYHDYKIWADRAGQKAMSQNMFVRFIKERFNVEVENKYHADIGRGVRTFVEKL